MRSRFPAATRASRAPRLGDLTIDKPTADLQAEEERAANEEHGHLGRESHTFAPVLRSRLSSRGRRSGGRSMSKSLD
jgi:hypothetical protein